LSPPRLVLAPADPPAEVMMARGFESKSVADQQELREGATPARGDVVPAARKTLELARVDVEQRLRTATHGPHREMLQRALKAIDADMAKR